MAENEGKASERDDLTMPSDPLATQTGVPAVPTASDMPTIAGSDSPSPIGEEILGTFGEYELLEQIGEGGMGVVYKARHTVLNRQVALKRIRAGQFASAAERQRFRLEASVVANLDHPRIVPIYEVGETEGHPFFSMKLMEGGTLAQAFDKGDWNALGVERDRRAATLVANVARAVHHAHQHGILHRDLKPGNILLDSQGDAHVTDFGLAKRVDDGNRQGVWTHAGVGPRTESGAILGTPSYMAPEQASSDKGLSTSADIYSLGAILYHLLTSRPPFQAATALDILIQVKEVEPTAPRRFNPGLDRDLETICLKCLAKDPIRRYASAELLAEDLERWLAGEPIEARRASNWERLVKWSKRRPAAAALLAVSVVAAIGLLTLAGLLWNDAEQRAVAVKSLAAADRMIEEKKVELESLRGIADTEQAKAAAERAKAETERFKSEEARESARHTLYAADMHFGLAAWETDDLSRLVGLLEGHKPRPGEKDIRGFEWNYLWRLYRGDRITLAAHPLPPDAAEKQHPVLVAISPDGKTLASTSPYQDIKLWEIATGKPDRSFPGIRGAVALGFSDDAKHTIVSTVKPRTALDQIRTIQEIMSAKNKPSVAAVVNMLGARSVDVGSGMERETAALNALQSINLLFSLGRQKEPILPPIIFLSEQRGFMPLGLSLAPDKKTFALGGLVTTVTRMPPSVKKKQASILLWDFMPINLNLAQDLSISPKGLPAQSVKQEGALLFWDLEQGKERKLVLVQDGFQTAVAFSPDGKTVASAGMGKSIRLWNPLTGAELATLGEHAATVSVLTFSKDSKALVSASIDGIVKIWDIGKLQPSATLKGHQSGISSLAISSDGNTIVSASVDGTIKIWDRNSASNPASVKFDSAVLGLAFAGGPTTLCVIEQDGAIHHHDVQTDQPRGEVKIRAQIGMYTSVALSGDGRTVAVREAVNTVKFFDAGSGKELQSLTPGGALNAMILSADGKTLAASVTMPKKAVEIQVWNVTTGKKLLGIKNPSRYGVSMAFSQDGNTFAWAALDTPLQVWDVEPGKMRLQLPIAKLGLPVLSFSPKGDQLAVAHANKIRILDLAAGKEVRSIPVHSDLLATMAFSPDGRRLATGGGMGELGRGSGVKIWDLSTGREILNLGGANFAVSHLKFSPDGSRLAAAYTEDRSANPFVTSRPSEVKVWNASP